jgi:hypothetical protein
MRRDAEKKNVMGYVIVILIWKQCFSQPFYVIPMFYKRKLAKFNFTVCVLGKKNGYCYLCDETRGKWGVNEIAFCLEIFLTVIHEGTNNLVVY